MAAIHHPLSRWRDAFRLDEQVPTSLGSAAFLPLLFISHRRQIDGEIQVEPWSCLRVSDTQAAGRSPTKRSTGLSF